MFFRRPRDLHARLSDRRRYRAEIERLHERYLFSRNLYELQQDGVSLATFAQQKSHLARVIAKTVERGEYRFEPARVNWIVVDGKMRKIFALRLTDLIVHGVVAHVLEQAAAPALSPNLYSYRRGVSWWKAVADSAAYARAHRQGRPDPKTRGLYILRRDIDSYTDSIPVGPSSPLWPMLRALLCSPDSMQPILPADWALIEQVVRPEASFHGGGTFTLFRGVPTGQPISCVLFNVYLAHLDRELAAVPGGFYARYSDDLLFAHPDPKVVRDVDACITSRIARLGLQLNMQKSQTLFLTAAGRRSLDWPVARPTTAFRFLGCRVSAIGTVSLNNKKVRRLLRDIEQRATRTASVLSGRGLTETGRMVCSVINRIIDPKSDEFQQRSAALLRRAVTDRQQLKQLDYWIARIVGQAVTGRRDAKVWRHVAYRTIRADWRLVSVLHARNRWPGR